MPKLLIASTNPKKLKELEELLKDLPIKLLSLKDFSGVLEINFFIRWVCYCGSTRSYWQSMTYRGRHGFKAPLGQRFATFRGYWLRTTT